ncbi:MAG: hypothetical protein KC425_12425, partial [Anaerolineales bacterium]|nr:hypothetical protein [Anaerolineales bacterium]
MKRVFVVTLVLLALVVAFNSSAATSSVTLIVQADNVETAVAVAQEYGGQIDEVLGIIHAVSVTLPEKQAASLKADQRVNIFEDGLVNPAGHDDDDDEHGNHHDNPPAAVAFPNVLGADAVWEAGIDGSGVTIAVVDSGIAKMGWNHGRVLETY